MGLRAESDKLGGLSPDEITTAIELLGRLQPGFLPGEIFHAIARLTVLTALEMVPFRLDEMGRTQVLLIRRSLQDKFWPNMLHVPGTIIRATDEGENFEGAIERLLKEEMGDPPVVRGPIVFGVGLHPSVRGVETLIMSWVQLQDSPKGEFYLVDDLPTELIEEQIPLIHQAMGNFREKI